MTSQDNIPEKHQKKVLLIDTGNKIIPRTMKLYIGPTITPFNRHSLSSIPSANEVVLFKKPLITGSDPSNRSSLISYGDNLQISLSKRESKKNSFLSEDSQLSSISSSSKDKKKKKTSIPLRFDYSSIESSKYLPGPGDYSPHILCEYSKLPGNFRYHSLFDYGRENIPSLIYNGSGNDLGPGAYDVKFGSNSNIFISKNERFKEKKIDESERKLGPGIYNINFNFCQKFKDKESFFFKIKKGIKEDKGKNLINEINESNYKKGNLESNVNSNVKMKNKKNNIYQKPKTIEDIKNEIIKQHLNESKESQNSMLNEQKKEQEYNYQGIVDLAKSKEVNKYSHVMNSKCPRFLDLVEKRGIPGPCYYQPNMIRSNIPFNSNLEKKWI